MKALEQIERELRNSEAARDRLRQMLYVADELELSADWCWVDHYNSAIKLHFYSDGIIEGSARATDLMRRLLPTVGHFEKSYNEVQGDWTLTGVYKGVTLALTFGTPTSCTVERVEEHTTIPEHTETKVRFVLKGDCLPLLAITEDTDADQRTEAIAA